MPAEVLRPVIRQLEELSINRRGQFAQQVLQLNRNPPASEFDVYVEALAWPDSRLEPDARIGAAGMDLHANACWKSASLWKSGRVSESAAMVLRRSFIGQPAVIDRDATPSSQRLARDCGRLSVVRPSRPLSQIERLEKAPLAELLLFAGGSRGVCESLKIELAVLVSEQLDCLKPDPLDFVL
jgi:hypothetical protein